MLSQRSTNIEIMDDFQCEGPVVNQTLKELDIINRLLGGNQISVDAIQKILIKEHSSSPKSPLKIADLGCGSGELLKLIAKNAKRKNIPVALFGVDANSFIIDYAKNHTKGYNEITYITTDVTEEKFYSQKFDIINCTLFCHHFDDSALISLLKNLYINTNKAIIINDIHRHWFAYHSIKWLTRLFSSSPMVKYDAKLSVLRSFKRKELEWILQQAGIVNYSIKWKWAFRYEIIIDCHKN
jgi:2-polyprenyl-3-methyl-5-hydroxy-6-metoxy-1,4-benzoquinol methylase